MLRLFVDKIAQKTPVGVSKHVQGLSDKKLAWPQLDLPFPNLLWCSASHASMFELKSLNESRSKKSN